MMKDSFSKRQEKVEKMMHAKTYKILQRLIHLEIWEHIRQLKSPHEKFGKN